MGNSQTNEKIENALDPNKNGFVNSLDPTKNGFVNSLDPTKNGLSSSIVNNPDIQKIINDGSTIKQVISNVNPNNLNNLINQIKSELSKNPNPKEITKQIINDPTLNQITKPIQPILQPIINKTVDPIVNNLPTTINPSDVVKSGVTISNQIISSITPTIKPKIDNTTLYLIIFGVVIGVYVFVPNKKKINNNV